jgi:hypothetical protein
VICGVELSARLSVTSNRVTKPDAVSHGVETCNLDAMNHGVDPQSPKLSLRRQGSKREFSSKKQGQIVKNYVVVVGSLKM